MRFSSALLAASLSIAGCKKADEKPSSSKKAADGPAAGAEMTVTTTSPEARAAFDRGRELTDKVRAAEAVEHFRQAIQLDPDFALAHAYLGVVTPGPAGVTELERAVKLAAHLPDAERAAIEARHLDRIGKHEEAFAAYRRAAELAPGDWRTQYIVGITQSGRRDYQGAIATLEKLQKLKPDLPDAYNGLAYAHAGLRQWEPAIAAAKKQVELMPGEPNPHDTLGEVLLLAGKFDQAEAAFSRATMDPKFAGGWQGVGLARAYRGDLDGAAAAFLNQEGAAQNPNDRIGAKLDEAWVYWIQKKHDQAYRVLDKLDADPTLKTAPSFAFVAMDRGHMLQDEGKFEQAARAYAVAKERAASQSGATRQGIERGHAIGMLRNAALSGAKPGAEEAALLAGLEVDAARMADEPRMQSFTAWGRGLHAWARSAPEQAVAELSKCGEMHPVCRWDLATVQRASGDAAGADATVAAIKERPQRDLTVVLVWSKIAGAK
jgi:tetratricopeptide (TPR) repeat protein